MDFYNYNRSLKTIYAIKHNKTKRIFVGQSANVENAIKLRMLRLRNGNDTNEKMQKDYDEFGNDFSFYKLEEYDPYKDGNKLSMWTSKLKADDPEKGYNKPKKIETQSITFTNGEPEVE